MRSMPYSAFKTLVSSVLAQPENPDWDFVSLSEGVHEAACERALMEVHPAAGAAPRIALVGQDFARLVNVVRDLIEERVLRPGRSEVTSPEDLAGLGLPYFHVTELGRVQFAIFKKGH